MMAIIFGSVRGTGTVRYECRSPLVGIAAAVVLALNLGFLAGRGRQMNLEQWTVAAPPLVFLLMAGKSTRPSPFWAAARLRLRQGRAGLLHPLLRFPRLRDLLFYARLLPSGRLPARWKRAAASDPSPFGTFGRERRILSPDRKCDKPQARIGTNDGSESVETCRIPMVIAASQHPWAETPMIVPAR
jgi:hypothetical protein